MSKGRIAALFASASDRKMLIPYICAGDPDLQTTLQLMHTLVDAGGDIIELGIPFSDPMADGPVNQAACERALKAGADLGLIIEMVARFRQSDSSTPVVLMGYLNPIEIMGYSRFAGLASAAGIDGVLTVDLPPEEAGDLVAELEANNLDAIFLLSPTSPDARIESVCKTASGYLYYVSLRGVTGAANLDTDEVAAKVAYIQSFTELPVAVGFGIRDAQSAAAIAATADGVIVGSALVNIIAEQAADTTRMHRMLHSKVHSMRVAMDAEPPAGQSVSM